MYFGAKTEPINALGRFKMKLFNLESVFVNFMPLFDNFQKIIELKRV